MCGSSAHPLRSLGHGAVLNRVVKIGFGLLLVAGTISAAPQTTARFVIQPGPLEGKDTCWGTVYQQGGKPNDPALDCGGWADAYYDYFQFDLDSNAVPSASETTSVFFEVYQYTARPYDPQIEVDQITAPWTEAGVTAANNPPSIYSTMMPPIHAGWNAVEITGLYLSWVTGSTPNYGIKLSPHYTSESNGTFVSSDSSDFANRPRLVINYQPAPSLPRRLAFPLQGDSPTHTIPGLGPYTASIISIFDHTMENSLGQYQILDCDDPNSRQVQAFTGNLGDCTQYASGTPCRNGCPQGAVPTPFLLTGNYQGRRALPQNQILNYDGHPGYDYRASIGTPVFAPTAGYIYYPYKIVGTLGNSAYYTYHVLGLRPADNANLRLYFIHLSSHPSVPNSGFIPAGNDPYQGGVFVRRGQQIGLTGDAGVPGAPHLHFEVQVLVPFSGLPSNTVTPLISPEDPDPRHPTIGAVPVDPYGWNRDAGMDPYESILGAGSGVINVRLWDGWH
jgi:hypothetical protein